MSLNVHPCSKYKIVQASNFPNIIGPWLRGYPPFRNCTCHAPLEHSSAVRCRRRAASAPQCQRMKGISTCPVGNSKSPETSWGGRMLLRTNLISRCPVGEKSIQWSNKTGRMNCWGASSLGDAQIWAMHCSSFWTKFVHSTALAKL